MEPDILDILMGGGQVSMEAHPDFTVGEPLTGMGILGTLSPEPTGLLGGLARAGKGVLRFLDQGVTGPLSRRPLSEFLGLSGDGKTAAQRAYDEYRSMQFEIGTYNDHQRLTRAQLDEAAQPYMGGATEALTDAFQTRTAATRAARDYADQGRTDEAVDALRRLSAARQTPLDETILNILEGGSP